MTLEGWYTVGVIVLVMVALIRNVGPTDLVLLGGAVLVGTAQIVSYEQMVSGFVNQGTVTIAAMFVIAAAMRETGLLDSVGTWIFGKSTTERSGLIRMFFPVATMSAFFNNTPIVAMLLPVVGDWCRKNGISPSRLLMPLSFIAILGGTCTLIGTSTNLVVHGLLMDQAEVRRAQAEEHIEAGNIELANEELAVVEQLGELGLFEFAPLGIVFVIVGSLYLLFVGNKLLRDRLDVFKRAEADPRSYWADMEIQEGCKLIGQSVEEAGLRRLEGLFLAEITRDDQVITPVAPSQVLQEGDILTFTGVVNTIVDLERIQGLVPVADEGYEVRAIERRGKTLCEAVVSLSSPLIGKSIRDAEFRARYNAAVVAVHRGGEQISGRLGDIVLKSGDTLLLQAGAHFARAHRNNPGFYLVSDIADARHVRHESAWVALFFMVALVVMMGTYNVVHQVPIPVIALTVAFFMIVSRCISSGAARKSIDWEIILTIGSAFALGHALDNSGAAEVIAENLAAAAGALGPHAVLFAIYALTGLFAALISSKAAVVVMFFIAVNTATALGLNPKPFVMAVAYAAAATFATPLGYPTNLLVYGPGGYKFTDFMRVGIPLTIILSVIAVALIPLIWPF